MIVENRAGARQLAQELTGLGHRRFAVLGGTGRPLDRAGPQAGFVDGLARAGIAAATSSWSTAPFTRDGGYAAAEQLVAAGLPATCVFACNDVVAVGAVAAFRDHGLAVPRDVSVAGFDDIETLRDLVPALTTVHLDLAGIGSSAATLALDSDPARPRGSSGSRATSSSGTARPSRSDLRSDGPSDATARARLSR